MFLFPLIQTVLFLSANAEGPNEEDGLDGKPLVRAVTRTGLRRQLASLREEVDSMNRTLLSLISGLSRNDVNFEVTSSRHVTMHPTQIYKFDTVLLNNGGGYHAPTGIFEAPVSGTYLFWANVHNMDTSIHVILYKEGHRLALSSTRSHYGECSLLYLAEVRKGEKIWFISGSSVTKIYGSKHSRYGGVLLQAK